MIGPLGWRGTYAVYGLLFALAIPIVALIVREDGRQPRAPGAAAFSEAGMTTRRALRARAFYVLVVSLTLAQLTYLSVLTQIVPHLEDVGFDRGTAAAGLGAMAIFGAIGKVSFGWLTEHVPSRFVLMLSLGLQALGLGILVLAGDSGIVWSFVPIFGLGFGALGALMTLLVQETFRCPRVRHDLWPRQLLHPGRLDRRATAGRRFVRGDGWLRRRVHCDRDPVRRRRRTPSVRRAASHPRCRRRAGRRRLTLIGEQKPRSACEPL